MAMIRKITLRNSVPRERKELVAKFGEIETLLAIRAYVSKKRDQSRLSARSSVLLKKKWHRS